MISSLLERLNGYCFLLRRLPDGSIDAGGSFASIFRHSSDGKGFATVRVGQQMLQGFHLPPLALLSRLVG